VVLPNGQIVASCFLVITMQSFHDVDHYRVLQGNYTELTVQVVAGRGYTADTGRRIKQEIEKAVQGQLQVRIETVSEIPRDPSGKIRTVVSRVDP